MIKSIAVAFSAAVFSLLLPGVTRAVTIDSNTSGNVFVENTPLAFHVTGGATINYSVVDYWGKTVAAGDVATSAGSANLVLPNLPRGWYEMTASDGQGRTSVSLGVVIDRHGAPLPKSGRIDADSASTYLLHDESLRLPFAKLVARAGIPRVRERIFWSYSEPSKGVFDWSHIESTMQNLHSQGISVDQVWSDTPGWARSLEHASCAPDDLRDLYNWTRASASHFKTEVSSWEVSNEEDAPQVWPDLGDRFAAFQKAAYWGYKDGNPDSIVLMGAMSGNPNYNSTTAAFLDNVYESGISDYYDRFNWHHYTTPEKDAELLAYFRSGQRAFGAAIRPAWLTEAGEPVDGTEGPSKRLLSVDAARTQAQFIGPMAAEAIRGDTDHVFYFVLVDYMEGNTQFGALRADLTPNPSFIALSAAANILGQSAYRGNYPAPMGATALLFHTPSGNVLAAWSNRPVQLSIPSSAASVGIANIFAAPSRLSVKNGYAHVSLGRDIVYINADNSAILRKVTPPMPSPVTMAQPRPSRIVLEGFANLPKNADRDTSLWPSGTSFPFEVQVYNFYQNVSQTGKVTVDVPRGWKVSPSQFDCHIAPMGRQVLESTITPSGGASTGLNRIVARGAFASEHVAPSVSYLSVDLSTLTPTETKPLDVLPASRWTSNISPNGIDTIKNIDNGIRIEATFSGVGGRWVFPIAIFAAPVDLSRYDGIAFDARTDSSNPNTLLQIQVGESGGALYYGSTLISRKTRRIIFRFKDLAYAPWSPGASINNKLDTDKITELMIGAGANQEDDQSGYDISNIQAVRFAPADTK